MSALPEHVKRIVAEIETEIGDEPSLPVAMIEGSLEDDHDATGNGSVEAAVKRILAEIGEDPERAGLVGTPGASIGCTRS